MAICLVLHINIKRMEKTMWGQKYGRTCQRCGKEMKRVAKYCIQCRKIVDDELGAKYRAKKK